MFTYKVKFYESGIKLVKSGVCTPFEVFQTGDYKAARKACIEVTLDDLSFTAILINQETGNTQLFSGGEEK